MLTDLLTSSKGPGVIGTLLALVVLVGFGSLMFFVNNDPGDGGLGGQIKDKQAGIRTAESKIKHWEAATTEYAERRKQKDQLDTLQRSLKRKQTEVTNAETQLEEAKVKLAEVGESFEEYKEKYRIAERAKAIGETMDKLNTKDGDVYEQVKILEVTAIGVKIMHKAGNTRVEYHRLPDEMQDRFQFTKEGAEKIAKQEAAQVAHSEQRAEGYHKAVAIRDIRTKISVEKQTISKATSMINTLNTNMRSYQSEIRTSQAKASKYRSLYASGRRGLTLDTAKKAEQRAALYQRKLKSAQSQIISLNKDISVANRNIAKLEAEIREVMKSK